jgi:Tfp pilus assembly protein PilZ
MQEDKRGRIRSNYDTTVALLFGEKTISSKHTKDISLNGLFVLTDHQVKIGDECKVIITLNSQVADLTLRLNAHVTRTTAEGIALTFKEMDIETYQHLKNIVLYNSDDPEAFLEQCQQRPGFR